MEYYQEIVKEGQSLADLAVQEYGSVDGIGLILSDNPTLADYADMPAAGTILNFQITPSQKFDKLQLVRDGKKLNLIKIEGFTTIPPLADQIAAVDDEELLTSIAEDRMEFRAQYMPIGRLTGGAGHRSGDDLKDLAYDLGDPFRLEFAVGTPTPDGAPIWAESPPFDVPVLFERFNPDSNLVGITFRRTTALGAPFDFTEADLPVLVSAGDKVKCTGNRLNGSTAVTYTLIGRFQQLNTTVMLHM